MMDKILLNKEDFNKINKTIKLILNIENSNNIKIKDKNILKNEDLMLKKQIRNE
jgi:spore cortex formation protein SpoVR/YcgB (stage V sporulation)